MRIGQKKATVTSLFRWRQHFYHMTSSQKIENMASTEIDVVFERLKCEGSLTP